MKINYFYPLILTGLLIGCGLKSTSSEETNKSLVANVPQQVIADSQYPTIVAVGDIACDPKDAQFNNFQGKDVNCHMKATSDLVINSKIAGLLVLGDLQYQDGTIDKFQKSYDPTWGRLKNITYPVPGNHEYNSKNAAGYYKYFGQRAGDPTKGYYSFNIGKWRLIALNSNCQYVGGCDINSPQVKWLKQELTKNPSQCTLAFWHHPRFSSGTHGDDRTYDAFWQVLHKGGVDVILNGHDHTYERFAKINPQGAKDQKGMREFVVGTGGVSLYKFNKNNPNTEARNSNTYGVLQLTLKPDGYDWQFVPENGKTFTDSGSDSCH